MRDSSKTLKVGDIREINSEDKQMSKYNGIIIRIIRIHCHLDKTISTIDGKSLTHNDIHKKSGEYINGLWERELR